MCALLAPTLPSSSAGLPTGMTALGQAWGWGAARVWEGEDVGLQGGQVSSGGGRSWAEWCLGPRPASEMPSGSGRAGGHTESTAVPLLPGLGGGRDKEGRRRWQQAGCSGMRGWGAWVEGAGGRDQGSPRMEVRAGREETRTGAEREEAGCR